MPLVLLRLLGPSRFRGPGPFEPIATGPALRGGTMPYPLPSTIAGVVASYAYLNDLCTPNIASVNDWNEVEKCVEATLKSLGVELSSAWALRVGFVFSSSRDGDKIYVYLPIEGSPKYVELPVLIDVVKDAVARYLEALHYYSKNEISRAEEIVENLKKDLKKQFKEFESKGSIRTPKTIERIGISLERTLKIARHGYVYVASDLDLHASFDYPHEEPSIAAEIVEATMNSPKNDRIPVKLSEGLPGLLEIYNGSVIDAVKGYAKESSNCFAFVQLTPILLPEGYVPSKYEPFTTTKVLEKLLGTKCKIYIALSDVPLLAQSRITVIVPGYSYAMDRYRSPQPAIVGATIYIAECDWNQAYKIYVEGIGEASKLGWGTLLPIPLPREVCEKALEVRKEIQSIFN